MRVEESASKVESVRGLESDKQIKKVREGEEDKVVRDRGKNKGMNIL